MSAFPFLCLYSAPSSLLQSVTDEIIAEAKLKKKTTPVADATKKKNTKSTSTKTDRLEDDIDDEIVQSATRSKSSTKPAAKSSTAPTASASKSPSSAATPSPASTSYSGPVALDSTGWEEWKDFDKFASKEEEAEFLKWQKIIEDEEKIVDAELAAEEEERLSNEIDDDVDEDELDENVDEDEGEDEDEYINDEMDELTPEELEELDKREIDIIENEDAEEDDVDSIDDRDEIDVRSTVDGLEEPLELDPFPDAPVKPSRSHIRSSPSVIKGGIRTRMLNVGGEQVMEISGTDEPDDIDDEEDGDENEPEWEDDVDMSEVENSEQQDPTSEVGRGVGGVLFTRDEIMTLSEKDLVESYTKGSGRGGQKLNKTTSCVHLLHLPTGTRVKCQFSRDLQANRQRARTIMKLRLEELLLGAQSRTAQKAAKERRKKDRK